MIKVMPTTCIVVKSDASIREVIDEMLASNNSYVLVRDSNGSLAGIFTDFDLLKNFASISDDSHLDRPVSVIMSRPVRTLSVDLIHMAGEFMLEHGVRHVPIVKPSKSGSKELLGVITETAVFEAMIKLKGMPPIFGVGSDQSTRRLLGVLSPDGDLFFTFDKIFKESQSVDIQRYHFSQMDEPDEVKKAAELCDAILVDLDDAPSGEWLDCIKYLLSSSELDAVCVIYTPELHKQNVVELMQAIKVSGGAFVYKKPLDVAQLMFDLEGRWQTQSSVKV